jgi:hypothetical protein
MTGPHPTPRSSTTPLAADTNRCESGSCAPRPTHRPILEWDNAWSDGQGGYEAPEHAELEARAMFQRILALWAMDVLRLKAAGLDRPAHPDRTLPALDALPLRPAAAPRCRAA